LQAFTAKNQHWKKMQQYTASLLFKDDLLCVSCPRISHLIFWDTKTHTFIDQHIFSDVTGLACSNGKILASNGKGLLKILDRIHPITGPTSDNKLALKFDNHMTMINAGLVP
jgi:hypothetical protein